MLLALGLVVVSFAGYVGLDRLPVLAQVTAFRAQWALVEVGVLVLLGWWLRAAALPLLGVLLLSVGLLVPRVVAADPPAGVELRVYSANVRFSAADVDALAASVAEQGSDVVALPEASRRYAERLADRLRDRGLDFTVSSGAGGYSSGGNTSLLVRTSMDPQTLSGPVGLLSSTIAATVQVGGRRVRIEAVHPSSPVPGDEGDWADDLARLQPSCRTVAPTVVLGDLNATLDHSGLRAMIDAGCTDAAASTGDSLVGTWPQDAPRWLGVQIDHVLLAGGVRAQQVQVLEQPGSDHRAVAAVLVLP